MLADLAGHLDCTTRKLRIAVGLLPAYLTTLIVSVPAFAESIHDLPGFCLTTACSLRHKLIIEDLQHVSSLNLAPAGYQPTFSRCRAARAALTKQSYQPSSFTGSRRWIQLLTTAFEPLRLAPLSAPAIYLPDIVRLFWLPETVSNPRPDAVASATPGLRQGGFR